MDCVFKRALLYHSTQNRSGSNSRPICFVRSCIAGSSEQPDTHQYHVANRSCGILLWALTSPKLEEHGRASGVLTRCQVEETIGSMHDDLNRTLGRPDFTIPPSGETTCDLDGSALPVAPSGMHDLIVVRDEQVELFWVFINDDGEDSIHLMASRSLPTLSKSAQDKLRAAEPDEETRKRREKGERRIARVMRCRQACMASRERRKQKLAQKAAAETKLKKP